MDFHGSQARLPPPVPSLIQGWVAVEKSGEKVERESYGCGAATEEEAHGLFQLYSGPPEEPAVEATSRAGICDHCRPSSRTDLVSTPPPKKKHIEIEDDWF